MKTWLILDTNYLAWRAFHVFGRLAHEAVGTGVLYGVLKDVISLQEQHATRSTVFCFDHGKKLKRQEVYPGYKKKRRTDVSEEKQIQMNEVRRQITSLKTEILPYLGFKNIFFENGYEADDIIASVVAGLPVTDEKVIVSGDKDLYQLLAKNVYIWNPNSGAKVKSMTSDLFLALYGITPDLWATVKAIAGCSTDEVPGLKGVGEKTAAKFFTPGAKVTERIREEIYDWMASGLYLRSLDLVRLPYTGTPDYNPVEDQINVKRWKKLTKRLGMKTLIDQLPGE